MKVPKTTQHTKSAQVIASIDDLLTEILLRLPVKSLIRFKIVSKNWLSLITNPTFCLRRNPNPNPAVGLFLPPCTNFRRNPLFEYLPFSPNSSTTPPFKKLKFIKDPSGIIILQSCNGLLLCSSFRALEDNTKYYVYNPTTNRFSILPKVDRATGVSSRVCGMSLVFDPAKSPHYKVLCVKDLELVSDSGDHQYRLEIYSPETGAWKSIGEPFAARVNFENGVYWNDAIHWIRYGDGDSLYFNIHRQALEKIPDPPMLGDEYVRREYYFGESCDHLHYVEICNKLKFNVYEMKRDYSEWFVKYRVDLSLVADANPSMIKSYFDQVIRFYYDFSMYAIVRDAEEEICFLVLQIPEKAIRYNLFSKTFETLRESEAAKFREPFIFSAPKGFQYIESLCSV